MKQKCRIKWAVEGDENSKFFHACVKKNVKNQSIKGINKQGVWCDNPEEIKVAVFDHFSKRFKETFFEVVFSEN